MNVWDEPSQIGNEPEQGGQPCNRADIRDGPHLHAKIR
jgi:hypothetical protein